MDFPDLSPYEYIPGFQWEGLLNVGWLDSDQPYASGTISMDLMDKLVSLVVDHRTALTRGLHYCYFCAPKRAEPHFRDRNAWRHTKFTWRSREILLGNGEIRVPGLAGRSYAAPTMILHYCWDHRYLPPEEFLAALAAYQPGLHEDRLWCESCALGSAEP